MKNQIRIDKYDHIFFDFDGVIKDSVEIKTNCFYEMFLPHGEKLAKKVKEHHLKNSGKSRYEKIPLYLKWAGFSLTPSLENRYLENFKSKVVDDVINSKWVKGVEKFLKMNVYSQSFYLVTATPQEEIELILSKIGLNDVFSSYFGSPLNKAKALDKIISSKALLRNKCSMIGDADADLEAARINKIDFVLREHDHNSFLSSDKRIKYKIKDFEGFIE